MKNVLFFFIFGDKPTRTVNVKFRMDDSRIPFFF